MVPLLERSNEHPLSQAALSLSYHTTKRHGMKFSGPSSDGGCFLQVAPQLDRYHWVRVEGSDFWASGLGYWF